MGVGGLGRATMRAAKAVTKGYSDTQAKVRDATKNDPTPPTSRELDDLAHLSYSQYVLKIYSIHEANGCYLRRPDFVEIMEILDKRLNDKGKLWRHVLKVCCQAKSLFALLGLS
jgi:epsin